MMAVRAANGCAMFRSAASPPLSVFRCRLVRFRTPLGLRFSLSRSDLERRMLVLNRGGSMRMCSVHSLVDSVLEEIEASSKRRKQRLVCAASKSAELAQKTPSSSAELIHFRPSLAYSATRSQIADMELASSWSDRVVADQSSPVLSSSLNRVLAK